MLEYFRHILSSGPAVSTAMRIAATLIVTVRPRRPCLRMGSWPHLLSGLYGADFPGGDDAVTVPAVNTAVLLIMRFGIRMTAGRLFAQSLP